MPGPVEIVLVTSDQGAAEEAARELSGTPGDEPLVSEKRGLDGGVAHGWCWARWRPGTSSRSSRSSFAWSSDRWWPRWCRRDRHRPGGRDAVRVRPGRAGRPVARQLRAQRANDATFELARIQGRSFCALAASRRGQSRALDAVVELLG